MQPTFDSDELKASTNLNERLECEPKTDANKSNSFINSPIIDVENTYASNSDIDEIIGDGKIQEFMNYIEHIDNEALATDKLQFKEYSENPKRLRYTSYNYDDKDDELDDFTVIMADDDDLSDVNEENYQTTQLHKIKSESDIDSARIQAETDRLNSMLNPYGKRFENKRKTNMFSDDTTRFLDFEKQSESKELLLKSIEKQNQIANQPKRDVLMKSKTINQNLALVTENTGSPLIKEATGGNNSPINVIDSSSLENITRQESLTSSVSSESNYFNYKRSSGSGSAYTREDSWLSTDSNALYKRSPSSFSDLEYIKGRPDYKDRPNNYDICDEFDSDNYHHHRRHSETADTLEYIRGRDDWPPHEPRYVRSNTLPRIYEQGEHPILIQDEIDSDEYHHNYHLNEAIRTANELSPKFLVHGSARSGRSRSPYKVLHADIDKNEFLQRYYWKGDGNAALAQKSRHFAKFDISEEIMLENENSIWMTDQNRQRRSKSPHSMRNHTPRIILPSTSRMDSESEDGFYDNDQSRVEINEVIENIIDSKIFSNESVCDKSPSEDIEIVVFDLANAADPDKNQQLESSSEPFVIISEATDDEQEVSVDEDERNNKKIVQNLPKIQIEMVADEFEYIENVDESVADTQIRSKIDDKSISLTDKETEKEIIRRENIQPSTSTTKKHSDTDTGKNIDESTTSDTVRKDSLTKINEQLGKRRKSQKSLKEATFDDLIQEGSMGLWFHK